MHLLLACVIILKVSLICGYGGIGIEQRAHPADDKASAQSCAVVDFVRAYANIQNRVPQTGRRAASASVKLPQT